MTSNKPLLIGLTGGIGAGKSTTLEIFEKLGSDCISADKIVHELFTHQEIKEKLKDKFTKTIFLKEEVDRQALARLVFNNPENRIWLENLLWPQVEKHIINWKKKTKSKIAVVEAPLLFEAGMQEMFDFVVVIIASEKLQQKRTALRGQVLLDERSKLLISEEEKIKQADQVIVNTGSYQELFEEVKNYFIKLNNF